VEMLLVVACVSGVSASTNSTLVACVVLFAATFICRVRILVPTAAILCSLIIANSVVIGQIKVMDSMPTK
jgi:hypothetical protein